MVQRRSNAYLFLGSSNGNNAVIATRLDLTGNDDLRPGLSPNGAYSVSLSPDNRSSQVFGNGDLYQDRWRNNICLVFIVTNHVDLF